MEEFSLKRQMEILNFNDEKRREWEKARLPYSALFELTARCNMNCVHCYLQKHHTEVELSLEEIKGIIDILYDKGILFLTLTGGEIFTRKDIAEIYMYAKRRGFMIELFTNGLALTDEMIEILVRYPPVMVDISIYGACEETYSKVTGINGAFSKVMDNCRKLKAANVRFCLRTPVLTLTIGELDDMRELANEIGTDLAISYEISPTIDRDMISQNYQLDTRTVLELEVRDFFENEGIKDTAVSPLPDGGPKPIFSCKMGRGALVIDYTGKLFPCMKFRHIGQKLTRTNYDDLWASFGIYSELMTKPDNKCNKCSAAYYCEVCPAEMDFIFGDMEYRTEDNCKIAFFIKDLHDNVFPSVQEALVTLDKLFGSTK